MGLLKQTMAHFMPPALIQLFTPRPTLELKPPPFQIKKNSVTGIAEFVQFFTKRDKLKPIKKAETPKQRKNRLKIRKIEEHKKILEKRISEWNPQNNPNATSDAYKTLFVARIDKEVTESDLRNEFSKYGVVRDVKLVHDTQTGKSRGYAFIEFDSSQDLKDAFKYAEGKKIKGKRILVDVERGRTVPGWKPRKLGGGMKRDVEKKISKAEGKYNVRRDRYRDRDKRDRIRRRRRSRSRRRD